jgi:YVTN family beta-propeller protein
VPFGSSTVSVIDTATRAVVATIPVGFEPAAVAILPDGSRAYVANAGDGTVSVIDIATRVVVGSATAVEDNPQGIAVSPDSARVYVTNFNSHSVSVIETASNTLAGTIQVGFVPYGIAVTPDGRRVYVVDNGSVAVIDAATQALTARVTLPPFHTSRRVAVSGDGARADVTINTPQSLLVVDTATNTVVGPAIPIIGIPEGIAIAPSASSAVPFAVFHVAVHRHATRKTLIFAAEGSFVLGRASDGVHPEREAVTVSLSTREGVIFTQTLPAASFHLTRRGGSLFRADPRATGIEEMLIRRAEHGRFVVDLRGRTDLGGPRHRARVTMSLRIGDDRGTGDSRPKDRERD